MIYKDRSSVDIEKKALKTIGKFYKISDIDSTILQSIPYEYPQRKINIETKCDEFTCVCPFSGLPDFAKLTISYVPRKKLIELKSLKYYLVAFRNVKVYNEHAVNKILEDLAKAVGPWGMTITGEFTARGGITNKITATWEK
jgi:7-cyano-7-deazaguanine reductase